MTARNGVCVTQNVSRVWGKKELNYGSGDEEHIEVLNFIPSKAMACLDHAKKFQGTFSDSSHFQIKESRARTGCGIQSEGMGGGGVVFMIFLKGRVFMPLSDTKASVHGPLALLFLEPECSRSHEKEHEQNKGFDL